MLLFRALSFINHPILSHKKRIFEDNFWAKIEMSGWMKTNMVSASYHARILSPKYGQSVATKKALTANIVNGGDWLWSPASIKGANKDAKIYVRRSTTLHNLLFCVHTLCMNYVTSTFLLVSSSVRSKQLLCFVQGQGQKREQKHTTKNFVGFHNHSLY